jgi:hypothetical protein
MVIFCEYVLENRNTDPETIQTATKSIAKQNETTRNDRNSETPGRPGTLRPPKGGATAQAQGIGFVHPVPDFGGFGFEAGGDVSNPECHRTAKCNTKTAKC